MYDVVIIGGGPAGISASLYAKRAGKKVVVLEANKVGGKILKAHMVDNYLGSEHITGEELGAKFLKQAIDLGVEIKYEKAMNILDGDDKKIVQTLDNMYETKTVIIATGKDKHDLGVQGEKELLGRGVSYCAVCDGNFFKNKDVVIAGGSEESINDALYLANLCNKVYFVYNNNNLDVSKLTNDNIKIISKTNVVSINGENKVDNVTLDNGVSLEVSGIFIAIANVPETSYLISWMNLDANGNVIVTEDLTTNREGIYVAGDIRVKSLRQVATAVSDGAIAATQAIKYLNESKKSFMIKIQKKNMINETDIEIDLGKIKYTSITSLPGSEDEQQEEKIIEDQKIINEFMDVVYKKSKVLLVSVYEKVNQLSKINRVENTAKNDLIIIDNGKEMKFDCYIQEYENIPVLFTVEVEKFIKNLK